MPGYANPQVLVSTEWVAEHAANPEVVLAEVNVDTDLYAQGHIDGAVGWSWRTQLCDPVKRDIVSKSEIEELLATSGATNPSTIVVYGDHNNWFAAWAFWQLKIYGHEDVRIMNGGRKKWVLENRPLTAEVPVVERTEYEASTPNTSIRAFLNDVLNMISTQDVDLVDVRSKEEFTGEVLAPPGLPETCQRGGHIPGAVHVPWNLTVADDGSFKTRDELFKLYWKAGVKGDRPVIAYCRIGERSSHTWFVLKWLLGYAYVSNYDGSWTEWGNLVGAPIEQGE